MPTYDIGLEHVSLAFATKTIFTDVTQGVFEGDRIGIVGRNGDGKSTLLHLFRGTQEPDSGRVTKRGGLTFGMLDQRDPLDDGATIREAALEGRADYEWASDNTSREIVEALLGGMSLDAKIGSLSGGQRRRADLARLLLKDWDILALDEPTNHLDVDAIHWLEDFLLDFEGTVIVVSHDRHFLNNVCTHIVDIDYGKVQIYVGNYEFWYESSQMVQRMIRDQNRKNEEKIKELQNFIQRFSANKSKSRQATSRKKLIEKLTVEELPASSRRYPWVGFTMDREAGKDILEVKGISKTIDGVKVLNDVSFIVRKGDKIGFISENELATTTLFQILMGEMEPDEGTFKWGVSTSQSYFPKDNSEFFNGHTENMLDWLAPYSKDTLESTLRGFLGRMLFSGNDVYKPVNVLSGGEKVRMMLSRMMLFGSNVLVIDQPTNHLDLESITAVNNGVADFKGNVLLATHDHEFMNTIANRIIELREDGVLDKECTYDEFLEFRSQYQKRA